ncbi:TPA: LysE family transporter [Escherichia coli]|uniref:LysE family transporter n=1 Tax=Escherichia TaxID=561 RepID=UPI0004495548|nr:homoserine/Threonine efflux family protein [Escherichia coli 1-176-05_S3_C2]WGM54009.1 LysE family transporter [Escherichia ruysiae]HAL9676883.1 LysE family transporter [Escherichia coli]HAV7813211.1 LysE family transporter [Escherichia coli]HAW5066909.1 LysE family transporter [Escherichia coli]
MDPLHAVYLTVGLFVITFFNPGANLFVVVQTSLASGRRAGVLTGLGVALGDAIYSGLGLFGMATLITQCEEIFSLIKIVGGSYLLWFAWNSMRRQSTPQMSTLQQPLSAPWYVFFRRGLITDLSNPQTVLFFISIFSVTLSAETPTWARLMAWAGIVLASVIWRIFLSQAFSLPAVRRAYGRMQQVASRIIGMVIGLFALRLIYEGVTRQ